MDKFQIGDIFLWYQKTTNYKGFLNYIIDINYHTLDYDTIFDVGYVWVRSSKSFKDENEYYIIHTDIFREMSNSVIKDNYHPLKGLI